MNFLSNKKSEIENLKNFYEILKLLASELKNYQTNHNLVNVSISDGNNKTNIELLENSLYRYETESFFDAKNVPTFDYNTSFQEILNTIKSDLLQISTDTKNKDKFIELMKSVLDFLSKSLPPIEETFRSYQQTIDQLNEKTSFLEHEKEKISFIVNKLNSGILVIDEQCNILLANTTIKYYFLKFFKLDIQEGLNLKFLPKNPLLDLILSNYQKDQHVSIQHELTDDFFTKIEFSKLLKSDNTYSYIIECIDISSLVQYDKIRNNFISMVSHELRAPITSIDMSIQNLISYYDKLDEDQRINLRNIIACNSKLMTEIINDLLLISKLDDRKIDLKFTNFSLNKSLEKVKLQLMAKISQKNLQLEYDITNDIVIVSDENRFEQIIRIILDNAIKYSHDNGKIIILARQTTVDNKMFNEIKIKDFGIGIKECDIHNLFQRFYRSSEVSKIQGSGLGLSIAKELIELHNGKISVESYFGKGSTFTILIPTNCTN